MATKERWILANEAAAIMTRNTDHAVSADYVRLVAKQGKIRYRAIDGRTNEYNLNDVERYEVRPKNAPRMRPRTSTRKEKAVA